MPIPQPKAAKQARAIVMELGIEGQDHGLTELQCLSVQHVLAEVQDLAMFVRRMSRLLKDDPSRIGLRALDYLKRHGLEGSVLRSEEGQERSVKTGGLRVFDPENT